MFTYIIAGILLNVKTTQFPGQGYSVVHIYFMYVCVFSSVGASCARDIAEKRQHL